VIDKPMCDAIVSALRETAVNDQQANIDVIAH
jgi:hypothetical protein